MCLKLNPRDAIRQKKRYQITNTNRMCKKQEDRVWPKEVREVFTKNFE